MAKPTPGRPPQTPTISVVVSLDGETQDQLDRIEEGISALLNQGQVQTERINNMAVNLTELADEVAGNSDVVASAERVLDGLVEQLSAASGNQAEVDAITAQLRDQKTRLAEAIANVGPHIEATDTP